MADKVIHAAGGIVVRGGARLRVAVVQRSKDDRWVLPRGKLKRNEDPVAGAEREALEETGHRVMVREFVGAMTYRAQGCSKVVQFWRMQAALHPSHDLMKDIIAVEWLPLAKAVRRLSYPLEKLFLRNVGQQSLKPRRRKAARKRSVAKAAKSAAKSAKRRATKRRSTRRV
ncbi:MAG: NUDIX domain-containing protein [Pseudolabrys sp.]|nr:NUDIX domain-containing protein [Pseudolabrys sp.]